MKKVCMAFLVIILITSFTGCEKQITYHQNIWGNFSKKKSNRETRRAINVSNYSFSKKQQDQQDKQLLNSDIDDNDKYKRNDVRDDRNVDKNKSVVKSKTAVKTDNSKNNILMLNQILNKNSKQSALARQEGQTSIVLNETNKAILSANNNKNSSEKKQNINVEDSNINKRDNLTKSDDNSKTNVKNNTNKRDNLTKSDDNFSKDELKKQNSIKIGDKDYYYLKENKKSLNDTEKFNSVKNEFSFGGL